MIWLTDIPCKHTVHRFQSFPSSLGYLFRCWSKDPVMYKSQQCKSRENLTHGLPVYLSTCSVHLGQLCDTSVMTEVLISWVLFDNGDNPLVKESTVRAPVWVEGCFFSVREISECYLTSRYPPILLNNVGHSLETAVCWFVIRTDKLNPSVQVCLAGSLHDYVTLLQVS